MTSVREGDPEIRKLGALLSTWSDLLPRACTIGQAIKEASTPSDDGELMQKRENLLEAMKDVATDRNGINSGSLGNWIAARKSRIINGLRFEEDGKLHKVLKWKVTTQL
jgi:hypothetical protein